MKEMCDLSEVGEMEEYQKMRLYGSMPFLLPCAQF